jgi:hypothetical protein
MVAWSLEDQEVVGFTIFVKPPVWTMDMGFTKFITTSQEMDGKFHLVM